VVKKAVVELIGAFFLVFTIGMTAIQPNDAGNLAPLAIGAALMVMVFAGGHYSGGHYNPAVSLAVWLRGRSTPAEFGTFVVAQVLGAVVAILVALFLKGSPQVTQIQPALVTALIAEFLFTFALCYVVLNVATAKGTAGNSFYGLAIGFTVVVGVFALGPVTGGALNPAVTVASVVAGALSVTNLVVYVVAQLLAGAAAAGVFRWLNPEDV
jgi:aquaporin Z